MQDGAKLPSPNALSGERFSQIDVKHNAVFKLGSFRSTITKRLSENTFEEYSSKLFSISFSAIMNF